MTVAVATVATHVGLVRTENQDRIVVGRWGLAPTHQGVEAMPVALSWPVVAVLDGMGGHTSGALAATCAAEVIAAGTQPPNEPGDAVALVEAANDAIFAVVSADPFRSGMGTTFAGLMLVGDQALVVNVGDSRVYAETDGYLMQLSIDDSSPAGHLVQSLGGLAEPQPFDVHVTTVATAGRRFLLASDGLFGAVDLAALEACLVPDDNETVRRLVDAALASGGADNIAVALVRCLAANDEHGGGHV